mmetsp:Transcript_36347/g.32620  ORF Transcript_36347/g.32620 Transcript_36347/m.32620 type:complete len:148 (+) Transcript_36347:36-479(+)
MPQGGDQTPNTMFHKCLDLTKMQTPELHPTMSTACNSLRKIPSRTTFISDRKGSLFSSFTSSRDRRTRSFHNAPTPCVKITAIIQKNSDKYFDETMAGSVDELLENGYTMVLNRKNQKIDFKNEKEELEEQIKEHEHDILPELNKFF